MATLAFDNLSSERLGTWSPIKLKLSPSNVQYKDEKTGKIGHFDPSNIKMAEWIFRVRGFGLCIKLQNKKRYYFDGFAENEFEKISNYFKDNYSVEVKNVETCLKGWNWGKPVFDGEYMEFHVDGKRCFDINLKDVNHVQRSKNEIIVQMNCADEAFSIFEMRFAPVSGQNDEAVEQMYDNILSQADVLETSGEAMVMLEDVHCLQPRGRYEIKVYPHFIHMRGKTYDYNVPKANFVRFYLLPHPDDRQIFFVMQINPPITHGQTRYYFIVLLFDNEENLELELKCTEEHIKENYKDISKSMSGPSYELITKLFKSVYNQKLTIPTKFESKAGSRAITCTYKTQSGFFYPLEKGFIFVPKPTVSIRSDEVACVNLTRASIMQRTFDFDIETKNGAIHTFTGVDKSEYSGLLEFIKAKKYVMSSSENATKMEDWGEDDDDSGNENAFSGISRRAEGGGGSRRRGNVAFNSVPDDDDDDDEEDEDFRPPEDYSGSSVAEEYDSEVQSSSGSSSDENSSGGGGGRDDDKSDKPPKEKSHNEKSHKKKPPPVKVKREHVSDKPSKSGGKRKAPKDPNAPKKPMTPFLLFSTEKRPEVVQNNPGKGIGDIAKIIGEMWKNLTEDEKVPYTEQYNEKKKSYDEEYKRYIAEGGGVKASSGHKSSGQKASSAKQHKSIEKAKQNKSVEKPGTFKSEEFVQSSDSSSD